MAYDALISTMPLDTLCTNIKGHGTLHTLTMPATDTSLMSAGPWPSSSPLPFLSDQMFYPTRSLIRPRA